MEKKTYYVNLGAGEISQVKEEIADFYTIQATSEEVALLRALLQKMHESDFTTFIRAHVPILPYHKDQSNDIYDENLVKVFEMMYQLGDENAKDHIVSMGILPLEHN